MIMNYMNGAPQVMAPPTGGPSDVMQWLQQQGYAPGGAPGVAPAGMPNGPVPGMPAGFGGAVSVGPQPGQPMPMAPQRPDMALGSWDGVNDKLRYMAQRQKFGRAGGQSPATGNIGGGGGGFGAMVHHLFGGHGVQQ
jgi:hypothetical protein